MTELVFNQQPIFLTNNAVGSAILLVAGVGDDAVGYQTTILEVCARGNVLLFVHESSLMLERVQLRGDLEVMAMMAQGSWYKGCLRSYQGRESCLVLQVLEAVEKPLEQYLLPQT